MPPLGGIVFPKKVCFMNNIFNFKNFCNTVQFPSKSQLIFVVNGTKMRETTKIMIFQQITKMLQAKTQMEGWFIRSDIQGMISTLMAESIIDIPTGDKISTLITNDWEDYRTTLPEK